MPWREERSWGARIRQTCVSAYCARARMARRARQRSPGASKSRRLILGCRVLGLVSGDQGADQGAEESFSPFTRVMDELKEPKIDREFLLGDATMRSQPGAQQ